MVKNLPEGDIKGASSIPGSGKSPRGGHGNSLQYFCIENPRDREAWLATVHRGHKESDTTKSTWHARTFQEESGSSFGTSERVDTSITASGCFSPTFSKVPTASLVPELA